MQLHPDKAPTTGPNTAADKTQADTIVVIITGGKAWTRVGPKFFSERPRVTAIDWRCKKVKRLVNAPTDGGDLVLTAVGVAYGFRAAVLPKTNLHG